MTVILLHHLHHQLSQIFPKSLQHILTLEIQDLSQKLDLNLETHFRVYDHEFILPVMSRAIRFANSVRKRML